MSFIGDAMRTIESVVLLRSKIEQMDAELAKTNDEMRRVVGTLIQLNGRLIRLETFEEIRTGVRPPLRIEE